MLDLIFPIRCLGCGNFSNKYVCEDCQKTVAFHFRYYCVFCGAETPYMHVCLKCKERHFLDQCLSVTSYKNILARKVVSAFKYKFIKDIGSDISQFLIRYLCLLEKRGLLDFNLKDMCVIPVPLHPRRLRWRSFNQAELLAKGISKHFRIKNYKDILIRTKYKMPQVEIGSESKKERKKNVKNSFLCKKTKRITGKIILLIDDVVTTGSTLNECARVLKEKGAKRVIGVTFAKG